MSDMSVTLFDSASFRQLNKRLSFSFWIGANLGPTYLKAYESLSGLGKFLF